MTPISIKPPRGEKDLAQDVEPPCSCGVSPLRRIESQGGALLALQCTRCGRYTPLQRRTRRTRCKDCGSSVKGAHALGCADVAMGIAIQDIQTTRRLRHEGADGSRSA